MTHKELVERCRFDGNVFRLQQYKCERGYYNVTPPVREPRRRFMSDKQRVAKGRKLFTFGGR